MRLFLAAALALAPCPAFAQALAQPVAQAGGEVMTPILAEAGPGARWGVVVTDAEGREIVAVNPEGRFMPASNTKLVTTAAALWAEARDAREPGRGPKLAESGTMVALWENNVVIVGRGDARLSSKPDCVAACLTELADAVVAKTRRVKDVIGNAILFPDQRWSPGMSWNNIPTNSGTAIAALTVDDNEIAATVTPGSLDDRPVVTLPAYYLIENRARTVMGNGNTLAFDRAPNSRVLVVTGTLGIAHAPVSWRLGVDDPADYAAWHLAEMLKARGVKISGTVGSDYCDEETVSAASENPSARCDWSTLGPAPIVLARVQPPTLRETVTTINKLSQNLYAELLLRRLGLAQGAGSIADGQAVISAMLAEAGVSPLQVSLSDGSGMSSYNRVTPRGMVRLLGWAAKQPWGPELRASLPVGGLDGTLRRRFAGTMLAGRIFAKTGTLNATNALAGWLTAASGRTLTFAIYANDVPDGVPATTIMDRALVALAAAN